jgi:hypothetical protein
VFDLAPALDGLREHAEFVADAVAVGRQAQRGHRIQETRRQPAQAAIAQRGVGLAALQVFQRGGVAHGRFGRRALQAQRGQRIAQRAADQELHRQVVDAARPGGAVGGVLRHPAAGQVFACHLGHGMHHVGGRGGGGGGGHGGQQVAVDRCGQRLLGVGGVHLGAARGLQGLETKQWLCPAVSADATAQRQRSRFLPAQARMHGRARASTMSPTQERR